MRFLSVLVVFCFVSTMARGSVDSRKLNRKIKKQTKKELQAVIKRRQAERERSERKRQNTQSSRLDAVRLKAKIRLVITTL